MNSTEIIRRSLVCGSLSGLAVDVFLYPIDTIKTRLQDRRRGLILQRSLLFSSLYSGVNSVLIGSGPSSALFFTIYNLTKEQISSPWASSIVAAINGEIGACLLRVPMELVKQRAQVNRDLSLVSIARSALNNEGFFGLYRGYFATISREIPFSMIQFPLWEFFKRLWGEKQQSVVLPWQGAICGSIAGAIAASLTTPLDVAKTRIMLAHHRDVDAVSNPLSVLRQIFKEEGIRGVYRGVAPRTLWISLGGLIYFGAFELSMKVFFGKKIV